jgi:hypothetical protein
MRKSMDRYMMFMIGNMTEKRKRIHFDSGKKAMTGGLFMILLSGLVLLLASCEKESQHLYRNHEINDVIKLAGEARKPLCIVLLDSTFKASGIYEQRLSDQYETLTAKAIFNRVDVNDRSNKWYREWLYPVSLPVTCIFDLSSDTLKLIDIIPGATHECFKEISRCISKRKASELRYVNRFSLEKSVILPALGNVFRCRMELDRHQDISREIEKTFEVIQYPCNWYLKALNAHEQGDDTAAVTAGNRMLAYDSPEDMELYSDLYQEIKSIIDKDYSAENEPALTFAADSIVLENCSLSVRRPFVIPFKNTGRRVLEIKDIVLSCGCVTLKGRKEFDINPQDVVDVEFEFQADAQGEVEREITVYSNGLIPVRKIQIRAFVK